MPADLAAETYYSLNQAADHAGVERQAFRKLIGEFEQKAGKLPLRINEHGKQSKYVPEDFLHIFEEAALWMKINEWAEAQAMSYTLGLHRSGALRQLATSVADRQPLLALPQYLHAAARELRTAAVTPQVVTAKISDAPGMLDVLDDLAYAVKWRRWEMPTLVITGVIVGFALGFVMVFLLFVNPLLVRIDNLQVDTNQQQYVLTQQLNRIEGRLKHR